MLQSTRLSRLVGFEVHAAAAQIGHSAAVVHGCGGRTGSRLLGFSCNKVDGPARSALALRRRARRPELPPARLPCSRRVNAAALFATSAAQLFFSSSLLAFSQCPFWGHECSLLSLDEPIHPSRHAAGSLNGLVNFSVGSFLELA